MEGYLSSFFISIYIYTPKAIDLFYIFHLNPMSEYSFKKAERLNSKKAINELFASSNSYGKSTLRILWREVDKSEDNIHCKVLIAVPKRKIKNAVDRNRIKRMLKEIYRKNKSTINAFFEEKNRHCHLGILFVGNSVATYESLDKNLKLLLDKLPIEYERLSQ